jgi:hypothetical protein
MEAGCMGGKNYQHEASAHIINKEKMYILGYIKVNVLGGIRHKQR